MTAAEIPGGAAGLLIAAGIFVTSLVGVYRKMASDKTKLEQYLQGEIKAVREALGKCEEDKGEQQQEITNLKAENKTQGNQISMMNGQIQMLVFSQFGVTIGKDGQPVPAARPPAPIPPPAPAPA